MESNLPLFLFTFDWNNTQHNFTEVLNYADIKGTIKRSEKYHGIFYSFIEELQLINAAASFVINAYDTHGIEAQITCTIEVNSDNLGTYIEIYSGLLDLPNLTFLDYDKDRPENSSVLSDATIVSVPLLSDQTDTDKLNSRSKNKTGLSDILTLDNEATAALTLLDITTHSKAIPLLFRSEPQTPVFFEQVNEGQQTRTIVFVSDIKFNEDNAGQASNPIFTAPENDTYTFTINGNLDFIYDLSVGSIPSSCVIQYNINAGAYTNLQLIPFNTSGTGAFSEPVAIDFDLVLVATDTVNIQIITTVLNDSDPGFDSFIEVEYNLTSEIVRYSIESDTLVKGALVFEALQKSLENMTSNTNPLNSDFYGRTDSTPAYGSDGENSLLAITNGFFLSKSVNGNDIIFSFDNIYRALDTLAPIGLGYELGQFRIEERSYFYNGAAPVLATFENIPGINITPAISYYFNQYLYGYDKSETESVKLNDEFNTTAEASTYHKIVDNTLDIRSPFIASGYAIESQRRNALNPEGGKYDSDNFYFAAVRSGGGFAAEKDAAFTDVQNIISPETSYNLRYSPLRNLYRHKAFLAASFYNTLLSEIVPKFIKGNKLLLTDLDTISLTESEGFDTDQVDRLFIPEVIEFEAPVSIDLWLSIKDTPTGKIKVSAGEQRYFEGFILESDYGFDSGLCTFVLLRYS